MRRLVLPATATKCHRSTGIFMFLCLLDGYPMATLAQQVAHNGAKEGIGLPPNPDEIPNPKKEQ